MSSSRDPFVPPFKPGRGPSETERQRDEPVMIDPSVLLTEAGLEWFLRSVRDGQARRSAVVPESFYWAVMEGPDEMLLPFVGRRDREMIGVARDMLRPVLEPVGTVGRFSHESVAALPADVRIVRDLLLRNGRPEASIFADEWVYLATQSWLIAKSKAFLSRVRQAGADVVEIIPRSTRLDRAVLVRGLIADVIPEAKIPDVVTPDVLRAARIKWVIYCAGSVSIGGAAGIIGGPVGGVIAGALGGAPIRRVIQAFDP
jgi:hypothetical protein